MASKKEAQARIKINHLLEIAGWRLVDSEKGRANIDLETKTDLGDDFENISDGFIDYLLLDDSQKPIAVLEAKRESIPPLSAKEQAREYANSVHARYIILSNGNTHYFWDMKFGNPEPISSFPTLESLQEDTKWIPDVETLAKEEVRNNYIALSQKPTFEDDPDYKDQNTRRAYLEKNKLKVLRNYQVKAIKSIQESAKQGNSRFLLEMATGTGKTLTCAAIIKLFLKTRNARRVLFLVDRVELERQAEKAFQQAIGNSYTIKIFKKARDSWNIADIVISTVQTLQSNDCYKDFSPTDFDLIISDEAHRSIGGNARAVFEYFKGFKIGLTATPKDYLKNTGADPNSEKEFERRELLDTYKTFGCESGQPTFRYGLNEGVNDKEGPFLVNPKIYDARTEITSKLLDKDGYAIHKVIDGEVIDDVFGFRDFEKRFFNEKTNVTLCETFLHYAAKDPLSGEIGKSIIFAVSQKHAEKIVQILNKIAMERWGNKYQSDFAIQITSNVANAQEYTTQFSENNLLGATKWLENYESSKARVAVTVGMMTTGYDCSDLLNVVFMRPVFSPSDFIQMKGRGTRLHTFRYVDYADGERLKTETKTSFNLIDFFAVCEYFDEKYDYKAPLIVSKITEQSLGLSPTLPVGYPEPSVVVYQPVDIGEDDVISRVNETIVGNEGMKIDREMFKDWQKVVRDDEKFVKLYSENADLAVDYFKNKILDKPSFFMTLEKLRKIFRLDRRIDVREAIDIVMNDEKPKTKDEKIKDYFDEFIMTKELGEKLVGGNYNDAFELFDSYITNAKVQNAIDSGNLSELAGFGAISLDKLASLRDIGVYQPLVAYIRDYIPVEKLRIPEGEL
jgi:type I restriction enzyme R subunit